MFRLGELNGHPVLVVDERRDIFDNKEEINYYIFKNKVYYKGKYVANYNQSERTVEWLPQEEDLPHLENKETTSTTGEIGWKEMLKPVDDMIKEMLEREL